MNPSEIHVLLYSFGQGCFHIETLDLTAAVGLKAYVQKRTMQDYIVVGIGLSNDEMSKLADELRAKYGHYAPTRSPQSGVKPIIIPKHPLWEEFTERLDGMITTCDGTHSRALQLLGEMHADVDATIEWLNSHGGHCDCEIMMNIAVTEAEKADRERAMGNN